jgi:hypothetical protein
VSPQYSLVLVDGPLLFGCKDTNKPAPVYKYIPPSLICSIIRLSTHRPHLPLTRTKHRHRESCPHKVSSSQHAYDESVVAGPAQTYQGGAGFFSERTQHNTAHEHTRTVLGSLDLHPCPTSLLTSPDSGSLQVSQHAESQNQNPEPNSYPSSPRASNQHGSALTSSFPSSSCRSITFQQPRASLVRGEAAQNAPGRSTLTVP